MKSKNFELECKLCSNNFDNNEYLPRIIPNCGHTLCSKCIYLELKSNKTSFKCPFD